MFVVMNTRQRILQTVKYMNPRRCKQLLCSAVWVLAIATSQTQSVQAFDRPIEFNRDVRPILANHCFACHGPDKGQRQADLRLDGEEFAKSQRGDALPAIIPGNLKSELISRVTHSDPELRMPPEDFGKPLTQQQLDILKRWVAGGAKWQEHWAYITPSRPEVPKVKDLNKVANPIDHFINNRLEQAGIEISESADASTLVRRLSLDLTGINPSWESISGYVENPTDASLTAYVESLLASKHYGERMALYWLDLVRYADSGGYHSDVAHFISPYRDYVIDAFNQNLPFDQFTREQLAGDLLEEPTQSQIIATGYNRLNKTTEEGGAQPGEYLVKYAADRVRTTAGAWLGVTLGCAECHDHKYDPFTQEDFYSFVAFFADIQEVGKYGGGKRDPEIRVATAEQEQQSREINEKLSVLIKELEDDPNNEELKKSKSDLAEQLKQIQSQYVRTMVTRATEPREIRVLPRGDWLDKTGKVVGPYYPSFLSADIPHADRRLSRLDLANWIASPENPLTARVFVNRLWKMFFGRGIANRLDDFGAQGEWPSHPALLDWLAVEFIESGWNVKHIVRLIVSSDAYQRTARPSAEQAEKDTQNELYSHQSNWRLEAEFKRDNALAAGQLLNRKVGGPSVKPYQPKGYWQHLNFPTRSWSHDTTDDQFRRGLYIHWQRTFLHPSLLAFDAPSREECTASRSISNTPKAALVLLNDPSFVEAAREFASQALSRSVENDQSRLNWMWRTVLSREPSKEEQSIVLDYLNASREHFKDKVSESVQLLNVGMKPPNKGVPAVEFAAWTSVGRALLNLDETITRP